jgi:internalin A
MINELICIESPSNEHLANLHKNTKELSIIKYIEADNGLQIPTLPYLIELSVYDSDLTSLKLFENLENIEKLVIENCINLRSINISSFKKLKHLIIRDCLNLKNIDGLINSESNVYELILENTSIEITPGATNESVEDLYISTIEKESCLSIDNLIKVFPNLRFLEITEYSSIIDFKEFKNSQIEGIIINCPSSQEDYIIDFIDNIKHLKYLKSLDIEFIELSEKILEKISEITQLRHLGLDACQIENISFLSILVNLESISLVDNKIEDISVFSKLTKLFDIDLSRNSIKNIEPLNVFKSLNTLCLDYNDIINFNPILQTILNSQTRFEWDSITFSNNPGSCDFNSLLAVNDVHYKSKPV